MIRNIIALIILPVFLTEPVFSESMMLSPAELEAIGLVSKARQSNDTTSTQDSNSSNIRLDGIIFHDEKNWCIWLNGYKFFYGQHHPTYKIVKVYHNRVEMRLVGAPEHDEPIILTVGQSH